jgi:hypothetical protein
MAVSNQQVAAWFASNPGVSDAQIAAAMTQFGVTPAQIAAVTGVPESQVAARVDAVLPPSNWDYDKYQKSLRSGDADYQQELSKLGGVMGVNAQNVYREILAQQQAGTAPAWYAGNTASPQAAAADYALRLAENGIGSLSQLGQSTVQGNFDSESGTFQETPVLINKTTGEPLPRQDLLGRGNRGLDIDYNIEFAPDGTALPYTGNRESTWMGLRENFIKPAAALALATVGAPAIGGFLAPGAAPAIQGAVGGAFAGGGAAALTGNDVLKGALLGGFGGYASGGGFGDLGGAATGPGYYNEITGQFIRDPNGGLLGPLTNATSGTNLASMSGYSYDPATQTWTDPTGAATTALTGVTNNAVTGRDLLTAAGAATAAGGAATAAGGAATGATGLPAGTGGLLSQALPSALQLGGGLLQSQTDREAAQEGAASINAATQQAVQGAQFRPIGMTTRFGTSQFQYDPVTGQMTGAGYQLTPEARAQQDRFAALAGQGITQAEAAQQQFAPLQTGAQSLFSLGNQYLAQSPQDVAQNYINQQMALLQPGRELELANLQNRLQQQGRAGLSVAQGGAMGATTPELQALYNARAQQEALLAAQAQQAGQQNVTFGAGLLGTGAQTLGNFYAGQQAAYAPYTSAMGQVTGLETAAQQPFTMSTGLAQQVSQAGANAGQLGLRGATSAADISMGRAATSNPFADLLYGVGSNNALAQGIQNIFGR